MVPESRAEIRRLVGSAIDDAIDIPMSETPSVELFHYTDSAGLKGILDSGALWASSAAQLNDGSEWQYADELAEDVFAQNVRAAPRLLDEWRRRASNEKRHSHPPLVACFCDEGDLLSQWYRYAAKGQGFAIGFDLTRLNTDEYRIGRINYEPAKQRDAVERSIQSFLHACYTHSVEPERYLSLLNGRLQRILPWFKHRGFREEREWRIAVRAELSDLIDEEEENSNERAEFKRVKELQARIPEYEPSHPPPMPVPTIESRLKFRTGQFGPVPYVEIPIRSIQSIRIGPSANRAAAEAGVRNMLNARGFDPSAINLSLSDIPLRG